MQIYSIYKATNTINGKIYIGFDSNWPHRKETHLTRAFNRKHNAYNTKFHRAIRKYSKVSFEWEIIYQSSDGNHCLLTMEPEFINEYKSYGKNGYNMTLGGEATLGWKPTTKQKKNISTKTKEGMKKWWNTLTSEEQADFKFKSGSAARGKKIVRTKEHQEKLTESIRKAHLGKPPWNKGIKRHNSQIPDLQVSSSDPTTTSA